MGKHSISSKVMRGTQCECQEKWFKRWSLLGLSPDNVKWMAIMWVFLNIRLVNEVLGDKAAREKLLERRKTGPDNLFELAILREVQKKDPSLFAPPPPDKSPQKKQ